MPSGTRYACGPFDPDQALPPQFAAIAQSVYADDPYWLGEDAVALQWRFSRANDFFQQGKAWLGVADGVVNSAARLAGFVHPQQVVDGKPVAWFGFWETADLLAPNKKLFEQLEQWAREQGASALYGPIDFNTFGRNRLRLNDFDQSCFPGEPYNPHYYPRLLTELGFGIERRYQSRFHLQAPVLTDELQPRLQASRAALQDQFRITPLTPDYWLDHLDDLYPLVDTIFRDNFAYTPISRAQFGASCGEAFARTFCPRTSVLATTPDGDVAGFFLCFPDYSPLLRHANPQRLTLEKIRYDLHAQLLPQPTLALAKTGGVHPRFRQSGLFNWMGLELVVRVGMHYDLLCGALMREDNPSLRFGMICPLQRDYGLFGKTL